MRTLTIALFLVVAAAPIAATAEPPPQAEQPPAATASAPAMTVADAQYNAVVVTQADTSTPVAAAVGVDSARDAANNERGHGLVFWVGILALAAIVGYLAYRFLTRGPDTIEASPRAKHYEEPPDPGDKRSRR